MDAIFFDLDGTLLHFTRDYRDVLADTFRTVHGVVREKWIDTYNETFYTLFNECEPEPVRRAFASVEICSDPDTLVETLREQEVEMCQPPENVHTDLETLAEHYSLGILTNGVREWQKYKLDAYDLTRHFDTVVASYEAGAHKPDSAPYRLAEERLSADSYAMVGDDDVDIEGAQKVDWMAYQYPEHGFGDILEAFE